MAGFLERLRNAPNADEIKRKADEAKAKYEQQQNIKVPEEAAAEEGDLSDYVMPFAGLTRGIVKTMAEKGAKEGGKFLSKAVVKEGVKDAKEGAIRYGKDKLADPKPAIQGPDYKKENIAFRPPEPGKQVGWERFQKKPASGK